MIKRVGTKKWRDKGKILALASVAVSPYFRTPLSPLEMDAAWSNKWHPPLRP